MGNIKLRIAFVCFFFVVGTLQFMVFAGWHYTRDMQRLDAVNGVVTTRAAEQLAETVRVDWLKQHEATKKPDVNYWHTVRHFEQVAELTKADAVYLMVPYRDTVWEYIYDSSQPSVLIDEDDLDDVGTWVPPSVLDAAALGEAVYSPMHQSHYGELSAAFAPVFDDRGDVVAVVGIDVAKTTMQMHVIEGLRDMATRFWLVLFMNIIVFDLIFARKCCGAHFRWLKESGEDCEHEQ